MNHPNIDNDVCEPSNPETDNNILGRNIVIFQPITPVPDCSRENVLASSNITTRNMIENEPNGSIVVPLDTSSHSETHTNVNPVSTQITTQEIIEPVIPSVTMVTSMMGLNSALIGNVLGTNVEAVLTIAASVMGLNSAVIGSASGTNVEVVSTHVESAISTVYTDNELKEDSVLNTMSSSREDVTEANLNRIEGGKNVMGQNITTPDCELCMNPETVYQEQSNFVNINDMSHEDSDYVMGEYGDPYLDVSLSGALEKLSVTELSVIDSLASLHMISSLGENPPNYAAHTDHNYHMRNNVNSTHVPSVTPITTNLFLSKCNLSSEQLP